MRGASPENKSRTFTPQHVSYGKLKRYLSSQSTDGKLAIYGTLERPQLALWEVEEAPVDILWEVGATPVDAVLWEVGKTSVDTMGSWKNLSCMRSWRNPS